MLNSAQKARLNHIISIIAIVSVSAALLIYGLSHYANVYVTPHDIHLGNTPLQTPLRLGARVKVGSVERTEQGKVLEFIAQDILTKEEIRVIYRGLAPALFQEGKLMLAEGTLIAPLQLRADRILAKHDENYQPPSLADKP